MHGVLSWTCSIPETRLCLKFRRLCRKRTQAEEKKGLSLIHIYFSDYINIGGNGSNQAYGKNVEVSSVESNAYKGEYTVDGDESTRWSSAYEDNQYIIVDLGEQMDISMVKLKWEDAYAKKYQIQISGNYNDWATVYENYNFTGGIEEVTLPVTSARYVKVYCIERADVYKRQDVHRRHIWK